MGICLVTGAASGIGLIPFGAKLLGNYPRSPTALALYGGLLTSLAGSRLALYRYVTGRPSLLSVPVPPSMRRAVTQVMVLAVCAFAAGVVFGGFVDPIVVLGIYGLTPVVFIAAISRIGREP
jgi:hypothetical protein